MKTEIENVDPQQSKWLKSFLVQIVVPTLVAVCLMLWGYYFNHEVFGAGMFLLVPFCVGLTIAYMAQGNHILLIVSGTTLLVSLCILLVTGVEGVACVILAFPILFFSIGFGAWIGKILRELFITKHGNTTIVLLCFGCVALTGWANNHPAPPKPLVVSSRMNFHAPMERVWSAVVNTGEIKGNASILQFLQLPIPLHCTYSGGEDRVCYFEEGEMYQKVTKNEFGKEFQMDITNCNFEVRKWLTFEDAAYKFVEHENYIEVIRSDTITSTLRPRWYWHWFEGKCIQLEHNYVMKCMKTKAEKLQD